MSPTARYQVRSMRNSMSLKYNRGSAQEGLQWIAGMGLSDSIEIATGDVW